MNNISITSDRDRRISLLRFLACLLIINSHCGDLYPISFLAVGGGQGNVLFFILSGYCLANIKLDFIPWLTKRYKKILPLTILSSLLYIIFVAKIDFVRNLPFTYLLKNLVNLYWFVFAIMIYYVIFYFIFKRATSTKLLLFALAYTILYTVIYVLCVDKTHFVVEQEGFSPFKVLFYCSPFIAGGIIKLDKDHLISKKNLLTSIICILLGLGIWGAEYINILFFKKYYEYQFLINLGILLFGLGTLIFVLNIKDKYFINHDKIWKYINIVSDSTLAIYLLQVSFKPLFLRFSFPSNAILFWLFCIIIGCIYNYLFKLLTEALQKIKRN